jgi:glucosamine kinase
MILIADSGSTKTDWVLTDTQNNQSRYSTIGYNPYFIDSENIYHSLNQNLATQLDAGKVRKVIFYGAGCSTTENSAIVQKAISKCFGNSEVLVEHDMLAAARALLGNSRGFAAIIGTGSNTCIYDGKDIEKNIDSLGYLLGDEGSGSAIGKRLIRDYMRGFLPPDLDHKFNTTYHLDSSSIFDSLYNKRSPNRYLANFCKFADQHKHHSYIRGIVKETFTDFFENLVSWYPDYEKSTFNCVGSVGYIFREQLKEVAGEYNMETGKLLSSPIDSLVDYHLKQGI